jgi:hypothetical protein
MQYILDSILTPLITEERKDVLLSCVASLESLDYQAALDELQQVVEIQDGISDNAMLLSRIDDVIWYAHNDIFKKHRVTMSDLATQAQRQAMVEVLSTFNNYIIPDQLLMLFEGQYMPEEILAHMCQMFTDISFEEMWPLIEDADRALMKAIKEEVERQVMYRGIPEEAVSPVSRIKLINYFLRNTPEETFSMVRELANAGTRVGGNIDNLVTISIQALDKLDAEQAAAQIFGLVLFSNVPAPEIVSKTKEIIADYSDDNWTVQVMNRANEPYYARLLETVNETP